MSLEAIKQIKDFAVNVDFIKEVFAIVKKEQPDILKRALRIIQDRYPDQTADMLIAIAIKRAPLEVIEREVKNHASVQN